MQKLLCNPRRKDLRIKILKEANRLESEKNQTTEGAAKKEHASNTVLVDN